MFAHRTDASKIALAALVARCRALDQPWIDCQQQTSHLASLGAQALPRDEFEAGLRVLTLRAGASPRWAYEPRHWEHLGV
jgi:leucyl/phenylalanyl-tRNA--protein transferase